jgi:4-hydroxy-2-oxoheptanedioate aldolase
MNVAHDLKVKMRSGTKLFGQIVGPGNDPAHTVTALKSYGDDFFILDLEHSLVNKETIFDYVRASREAGIPVLVRPEDKAAYFRRYLDAGVNGLMLPLVNTCQEAKYAVSQAYFPPIGHRGTGIGLSPYLIDRQDLQKVPFLALTEYINNNTLVLPQTESLASIDSLAQILSLDGIDGTIVGPWDLALDVGGIDPKALLADLVNTEAMERHLARIVDICQSSGKVAGIGAPTPEAVAKWAKAGYQLFLIGYIMDGNMAAQRPVIDEAKALLGYG